MRFILTITALLLASVPVSAQPKMQSRLQATVTNQVVELPGTVKHTAGESTAAPAVGYRQSIIIREKSERVRTDTRDKKAARLRLDKVESRTDKGAAKSIGRSVIDTVASGTGGGEPAPVTLPPDTIRATVTVLGTEITYGAGGPGMSVYLQPTFTAAQGGGSWTGPEELVTPGYTKTFETTEGELTLIGRARYGSVFNQLTGSSDPVYAAIVNSGENLNQVIAAKQIQPAFGMQASLASLLGEMYDAQTGIVTLPQNSVLILYEFDRTAVVAAKDYNDLMVLLTFETAVQTEILLRDGIDPVNYSGTVGIVSGWRANQDPPSTTVVVSELTVPVPSRLTTLELIVGDLTSNPTIENRYYNLSIWNSLAEAQSSIRVGTVANAAASPIAIENLGTYSPGRRRFKITFDLSGYGLVIPAGTYYYGTGVVWPFASAGVVGPLEALTDSVQSSGDYFVGSGGGYTLLCGSSQLCQHTGKIAYKLVATPLN